MHRFLHVQYQPAHESLAIYIKYEKSAARPQGTQNFINPPIGLRKMMNGIAYHGGPDHIILEGKLLSRAITLHA